MNISIEEIKTILMLINMHLIMLYPVLDNHQQRCWQAKIKTFNGAKKVKPNNQDLLNQEMSWSNCELNQKSRNKKVYHSLIDLSPLAAMYASKRGMIKSYQRWKMDLNGIFISEAGFVCKESNWTLIGFGHRAVLSV